MKSKNIIQNDHIIDVYISFADVTFNQDLDSDCYHRRHRYSRYQLMEYGDVVVSTMSGSNIENFSILKVGRRKKNESLFVTVKCPTTSEIYLIRFQILDMRGTDIHPDCMKGISSKRYVDDYFRRLAINDTEYANRFEMCYAMRTICRKIKEGTYTR